MTVSYSKRFLKQYAAAPAEVRKAFDKQSSLLLENLNHPSLHAKKYSESEDKWQARVTKSWRFYFKIIDNTYVIEDITPHPKK